MSSSSATLPAGLRMTTPAALCCFKGRDAARALEAAGVAVPARPNSWCALPSGSARDGSAGACLRLGSGEYLLVHDDDDAVIDALRSRALAAGLKCHALLRSDKCVHLQGEHATARLLQVCDIDERQFLRQPDALALVMLADVAVTLHAVTDAAGVQSGYRIWCDPTYALHVLDTFARIDARSTAVPSHTFSPRQFL